MQLRFPYRRALGSGSLSGRARVWVHQLELDRQLADGVDPASSPALLTRARQLQAIRCRQQLAVQIDAALGNAEHPPHWRSVRIPVRAVDVRAARDALCGLREALLACDADGLPRLTLAACLLNDPQGPLYQPCNGGAIAQLADEASNALAGRQPLT